jgi:hypothetical protein
MAYSGVVLEFDQSDLLVGVRHWFFKQNPEHLPTLPVSRHIHMLTA